MITLTAEQAQQIEEALWSCDAGDVSEALATLRASRAQEQAEQEPEYDLSNVIHLTHNKAKHIIESRGYFVTGFVLTREDGGKCIVDMSAVRWFDDKLVFQRMMHSDTPKKWLSPPVEHVKQEPVLVSDVFSFLLGEKPLNGVWFGEKPDGEKGNFWWRKHLREALATPVRTKDLTDDEILPDGYSVVTSYDGLLEFARALIAADREKNNANNNT